MFINPSQLKKQLKKSYTGGVHIGSLQDGIVISQGHFVMWIQYDKVPNEIKAIVAEFLGIIPQRNDGMFSARKDVPFAQAEVDIYSETLKGMQFCKSETVKTNITLDSAYQSVVLFQNTDFNTILGINKEYLALFDPEKCDFDNGETRPNQQPYTTNGNEMFLWLNDACKLIVMPVDLKANKTFQAMAPSLQMIDFEEVNK